MEGFNPFAPCPSVPAPFGRGGYQMQPMSCPMAMPTAAPNPRPATMRVYEGQMVDLRDFT